MSNLPNRSSQDVNVQEYYRRASQQPGFAGFTMDEAALGRPHISNDGWITDSRVVQQIGLRVRNKFTNGTVCDGTVIAALPLELNSGVPLWKVRFDNGIDENIDQRMLIMLRQNLVEDARELQQQQLQKQQQQQLYLQQQQHLQQQLQQQQQQQQHQAVGVKTLPAPSAPPAERPRPRRAEEEGGEQVYYPDGEEEEDYDGSDSDPEKDQMCALDSDLEGLDADSQLALLRKKYREAGYLPGRAVECLTKEGVLLHRFKSFRKIVNLNKFPLHGVRSTLMGLQQSSGGFVWRLYDEINLSLEERPISLNKLLEMREKAGRGPGKRPGRPSLTGRPAGRPPKPRPEVQLPPLVSLEEDKAKMLEEGWTFDAQSEKHIGMRIRRFFPGVGKSDGTVVAYLPPQANEGIPLWHMLHDDGDREDVEASEIDVWIQYMTNDVQTDPNPPAPAPELEATGATQQPQQQQQQQLPPQRTVISFLQQQPQQQQQQQQAVANMHTHALFQSPQHHALLQHQMLQQQQHAFVLQHPQLQAQVHSQIPFVALPAFGTNVNVSYGGMYAPQLFSAYQQQLQQQQQQLHQQQQQQFHAEYAPPRRAMVPRTRASRGSGVSRQRHRMFLTDQFRLPKKVGRPRVSGATPYVPIEIGDDYQVSEQVIQGMAPEESDRHMQATLEQMSWVPSLSETAVGNPSPFSEFVTRARKCQYPAGMIFQYLARPGWTSFACSLRGLEQKVALFKDFTQRLTSDQFLAFTGMKLIVVNFSSCFPTDDSLCHDVWFRLASESRDSSRSWSNVFEQALDEVSREAYNVCLSQFGEKEVVHFYDSRVALNDDLSKMRRSSNVLSSIPMTSLVRFHQMFLPFILRNKTNTRDRLVSLFRCADAVRSQDFVKSGAQTYFESFNRLELKNIPVFTEEQQTSYAIEADEGTASDLDMEERVRLIEQLDRQLPVVEGKAKLLPGQSRSAKAQNKPVEQVDMKSGKVLRRYASQGHAAQAMKCTQGVVSYCCRGEKPHAYNFKWRFYRGTLEDFDEPDSVTGYTPISDLLKIRFSNAIGFTRSKDVNLKSTNATSWTTDSDIIEKDAPSGSKKQVVAAEEPKAFSLDPSAGRFNPTNFDSGQVKYYCSHIKPVEQLELSTGKVVRRYLSGATAAKMMEGSQAAISLACRSRDHRQVAYNFRWRFYKGPPIDFDAESYVSVEDLLKIRHGPTLPIPGSLFGRSGSIIPTPHRSKRAIRSRAVEQLDRSSGAVLRQYPSIKMACEAMHIPFIMMANCLKGSSDTAAGYIWRYYTGPPIDFEERESEYVAVDRLYDARECERKKARRSRGIYIGSVSEEEVEEDDDDIRELDEEGPAAASTKPGEEKPRFRSVPVTHHCNLEPADRPVEQVDPETGLVVRRFPCIMLAVGALQCTEQAQNMYECCIGTRHTACGGFGWRFYPSSLQYPFDDPSYVPLDVLRKQVQEGDDEEDESDAAPVEDDSDEESYGGPVSRTARTRQPVEQLDKDTEQVLRRYPSQTAAMLVMQGTQALISACCRGVRDAAYGFKWRNYEGPPIDYDEEEAWYTPIGDLLAIRFGSGDPANAVKRQIARKRKRVSTEREVKIVSGKRRIKSRFSEAIFLRDDVEESDQKESDLENSNDESKEPNTGKSFLELVLEAVKHLESRHDTPNITAIRQTVMSLHPEILKDDASKPAVKTQLMNSIRAAVKDGVKNRVLDHKYGSAYHSVTTAPAPVSRDFRKDGNVYLYDLSDFGGSEEEEEEEAEVEDEEDEEYTDATRKSYSHIALEAVKALNSTQGSSVTIQDIRNYASITYPDQLYDLNMLRFAVDRAVACNSLERDQGTYQITPKGEEMLENLEDNLSDTPAYQPAAETVTRKRRSRPHVPARIGQLVHDAFRVLSPGSEGLTVMNIVNYGMKTHADSYSFSMPSFNSSKFVHSIQTYIVEGMDRGLFTYGDSENSFVICPESERASVMEQPREVEEDSDLDEIPRLTGSTFVENRKRAVDCFSLDGTFVRKFSSPGDAAYMLGTSELSVIQCCDGRLSACRGLTFQYAETLDINVIPTYKRSTSAPAAASGSVHESERRKELNRYIQSLIAAGFAPGVSVECISPEGILLRRFFNVEDAEKSLPFLKGIREACEGAQKKTSIFHWRLFSAENADLNEQFLPIELIQTLWQRRQEHSKEKRSRSSTGSRSSLGGGGASAHVPLFRSSYTGFPASSNTSSTPYLVMPHGNIQLHHHAAVVTDSRLQQQQQQQRAAAPVTSSDPVETGASAMATISAMAARYRQEAAASQSGQPGQRFDPDNYYYIQ